MTRIVTKFLHLLVFIVAVQLTSSAIACSRALWVNDKAVVIARTMDWQGDMQSNMFIYPRGFQRDGLADVNSMTWKAKYGTVITSSYDSLASDGINEKGFAMHIFLLNESDYGKRNPTLPGLSVLMWGQFYLDNFATVKEAIQYTHDHPFQIEPFELLYPVCLHLIISDPTGDTAVFEYIGGKLQIYHDRSLIATTNSPTLDKQIENLRLYKGFGGDKPLPGTTDSMDRFVRAWFYASHMPKPSSAHDAITKILSVIDTTAMPFGASSAERMQPSETIWKTALDLTNLVYYFESTDTRNLLWVNLKDINFKEGTPVLKLDIANGDNLSGDVTKEFKVVHEGNDLSLSKIKANNMMKGQQAQ